MLIAYCLLINLKTGSNILKQWYLCGLKDMVASVRMMLFCSHSGMLYMKVLCHF